MKSESVYQAFLSNPEYVHIYINKLLEIEHSYEMTNILKSIIDRTHSTIITSEYSDNVKLVIGVQVNQMVQFVADLNQLDSRYINVTDTGHYKMISDE